MKIRQYFKMETDSNLSIFFKFKLRPPDLFYDKRDGTFVFDTCLGYNLIKCLEEKYTNNSIINRMHKDKRK